MDRLNEIFQALRFAFTEPLADQIHVQWMSFQLSLKEFFYLSLTLYFVAGVVVGFLYARYRYRPQKKTIAQSGMPLTHPTAMSPREAHVKSKGELKHILDEVSATEDTDD
ncbi:hypothetical protein GTO91_06710 [Heliobacterium undosum]|uniref:Uncharacterized protein n=1 Tax=Heliomicrobium undosum TaxID=121734 RepID=A0A845L3H2_9FIRM|nr:hypothetical protein [Heliomicrobium undosum]MZP29394.1 hypothetical protein [Heliomicrobium undosum]